MYFLSDVENASKSTTVVENACIFDMYLGSLSRRSVPATIRPRTIRIRSVLGVNVDLVANKLATLSLRDALSEKPSHSRA
jgi:hypothetical protein